MRQILQPDSFGLAHSLADPMERADSWETSWPRAAGAAPSPTSWWAESDEGYTLLQRLALAHLLVGVCVALGLGWRAWAVVAPPLAPAIGLVVAVGGVLGLALIRLDRPASLHAPLFWARLALVGVDLAATGGILWLRGGEGWTLLALLPPVALAVVFFAERGGVLATALAALLIVGVNAGQRAPLSGWAPSLLVFLGVTGLVVAFLSIYSARVAETSLSLRWLLNDARATSDRLHGERQTLLLRTRAAEQSRDALHQERAQERARLGEASNDLAQLARRMAQGDSAATQAMQALHPGAYGPLADLASALARLARSPGSAWTNWRQSGITALDAAVTSLRAQGQGLATLDMMTRALCVTANELVMKAQALEPGVNLIGSGEYSQTLWQLEDHLRRQAAQMALLGTQLAAIRTSQENLEATLTRAMGGATAGAKTPAMFGVSDIHAVSQHSGPQAAFGASGVSPLRRVAAPQGSNGTVGRVPWENWQS